MSRFPHFLALAAATTALCFAPRLCQAQKARPASQRPVASPILTRVGSIALPQVEGRMDHFAFDSKRNRLWVAALENHSVEVLDVLQRRRVTALAGLTEPQGLVYEAEKDFVFVASRGDGTLRSFDARSFKAGPWVDIGRNTDNVRFDARSKTVYAGSGGEPGPGSLTAVKLSSMLPVSRGGIAAEPRSPADLRLQEPRQAEWQVQTELFSHPESFQIDRTRGQIYVNVPDEHTINVLKPAAQGLKITARWPVTLAKRNFPMVLDAAHARLFIICRNPALLLTYDINTGRCIGQVPCIGDGDDAFYDTATQRLFVIGGQGAVDVFAAAPQTSLRHLERVKTGVRARTGFFMPSLRMLAVAVPHIRQQKAQVLLFRIR